MKNLLTEFRKNLHLPFFIISLIGLNLLFFTSEAVKGSDGKGYSVWSILMMSGRLPLTSRLEFGWLSLWQAGLGPWTLLAAPVISCAGFIYCNAEEKKNRAECFIKIRQRRLTFTFGKVVSGIVCAGLTLTAAYALFGLILYPFFPKPDAYRESFGSVVDMTYGSSTALFVIKNLAGVFLLGCFMSLLPVILSSFLDDPYLLVSLPVLGTYLYERVIQRMYFTAFGMEHADILEALNLEGLPHVFDQARPDISLVILLLLITACFILYRLIRFKRRDELI